MLKNYWMAARRSLIRDKVYSLVNVLGLSLGICACLVIYLITRYEFSFDNFHPDRNRIFCVDAGMHGVHWNCVPVPMPDAMRREITGFETVAAFQKYTSGVSVPGGSEDKPKQFTDAGSIAIAEPSYFDIFHYQWLSGNPAKALSMPNSVVLTAEKARQYFGDIQPENIIGRTLHYQDSLIVTVTGVVANWTGNSDFNFSQWISYSTIAASSLRNSIPVNDWHAILQSSQVIVKLATDVKPTQINTQFIAFGKRHYGSSSPFSASLKPLSGIHFHQEYGGNGRKASLPVLYTLMVVAAFILILAIVNFINLSTAQSMQRAREIGVRKVLGSSRSGIAVQFFIETLLLTTAATCFAALMVKPVFGLFADWVPGAIHFRLNLATISFLLSVVIVTTLLAGFYPARVLASYQPAMTLKGIAATPGGGNARLRKALIVFQFTISLLFIIASIVIGSQLRYVLHTDLGFKTDAIITINYPPDKGTASTDVLVQKIRQLAGVEQVIKEGRPPIGEGHWGFGGGKLKGSEGKPIELSLYHGDENYVPFYGMRLVAGRNLLPGNTTRELLINTTCARALGFTDVNKAVGREVVVGPGQTYPVAGVLADFYESSLHQATSPVVIKHDPNWESTIAVKIAAKGMGAGKMKALIDEIGQNCITVFPSAPFHYSFLDESVAELYRDDLRTELLTNVATGITIFISCLGLLGLAIFSTQKRTREIGIRKVLGATATGIMAMLCKDIVSLILIALLIASPLAWYFLHGWLQSFAYRVDIGVWVFLAAGVAAIGIALCTVGFQAIKAATANPVKSLRSE